MTPERWRQIENLFQAALNIPKASGRTFYVKLVLVTTPFEKK